MKMAHKMNFISPSLQKIRRVRNIFSFRHSGGSVFRKSLLKVLFHRFTTNLLLSHQKGTFLKMNKWNTDVSMMCIALITCMFSILSVFMWYACVHVCMHTCACVCTLNVCVYTYGYPRLMLVYCLQSLIHLIHWVRVFQFNPEITSIASLTCQLAGG